MRLSLLSLLSLVAVASSSALPEGTLDLTRANVLTADQELDTKTHETTLQHYGPPPDGCEADEKAFQIQGIPGGICAAKCTDFLPCPTDVPDGVTATPMCALQDQSGLHYCVLLCQVRDAHLRGVQDDQCGDATCQEVKGQGVGICTYDM